MSPKLERCGKSPATDIHRRCLAARANGLLGKHGPSWLAEGVEDDDSPLGRVRRHGTHDAQRRREAEERAGAKERRQECASWESIRSRRPFDYCRTSLRFLSGELLVRFRQPCVAQKL
jgi:hypothetical protein